MQDPEIAWLALQRHQTANAWQDESFLNVALDRWILTSNRSAEAVSSLEHLGENLRTNHKDLWLLDFLHSAWSPRANDLLLQALQSNHAGDADRAYRAASGAYVEYLRHNNRAGALRSEVERIYALRRLSKDAECVGRASAARNSSSRLSYWWIDIQATIEQANCEGMRNKPDAARTLSNAAREMAVAAKYRNLELRAVGTSGNLALLEGNSEGTWASDEGGLKLFWEGSYPDDRAFQFYYNLQVDSERNRTIYLAEALQRETLKMIAGRSRFDFEAMAHFRMAGAATAVGDTETAQQEINSYRNLLERLPSSSARNVYEAYCEIGLARLAIQSESTRTALQHLDNAQPVVSRSENSSLLLEYLTTRADLARASSDTATEQNHLRNVVLIGNFGFENLRSPVDRWRWRQVVEGAYRRLLEIEVSRPHSPAHALGYWEFHRQLESEPSLPRAVASRVLRVESLAKARLPAFRSATIVSFAVLPQTLVAWVADDRGVREFILHARLPELRKQVRLFYSLCSDPRSDTAKVNASGARLYRLLIAPLEPALDPGRVWAIEPDGFLSLIPWSALVMPDGGYLGQARTITICPGLFANSTASRSTRPVKTVLAANPDSVRLNGHIFPTLAQAEEEGAELARLYAHTTLLRGSDVTVSNVLNQLPKANVFEFAGHALTREHGGELVVYGQNGGDILSASSISNLQLKHTGLVVLGACSTAAEGDADRDPNGLVRAFLNAGATQVLAGRWDLDSGSTTSLMKQFHRSFHAGMSGAESLKVARQELSSQDRFAHPYYWAGMEIFSANSIHKRR